MCWGGGGAAGGGNVLDREGAAERGNVLGRGGSWGRGMPHYTLVCIPPSCGGGGKYRGTLFF